MKKLLGLIIGSCMVFLFSVQAGAVDSGLQVQKRTPAPVQQAQPSTVQQQNIYYPVAYPSAQWVTHVSPTHSQNFHNASGVNNDSTAQQLKQFTQQTQQQMSDFSKL